MATITISRVVPLDAPHGVDNLTGCVFTAEETAHEFVIQGTRSREPVPFSGTVTAKCLRADNTMVEIMGDNAWIDEDGAAHVVLTRACYGVPGRIQLAVFLAEGDTRTCIYACVGIVCRTDSDTVVDDEDIIPSVEELVAEIERVVATIPSDYSTLSAGVVRHDIAQTLTPAQAAQARANIGAVREIVPDLRILTASVGNTKISTSTNDRRTVWFPCEPNTTYKIAKTPGSRFVIAESSETTLTYSSPVQNVHNVESDWTAGEITYTTSATAKTLAAFVWYENTDASIATAIEMLGSVRVYTTALSGGWADELPWMLTDGTRSVWGGTNLPFKQFYRGWNESLQAVIYKGGDLYVFANGSVRMITPTSIPETKTGITQFGHVQGVELLADGQFLVTASTDYQTDQETRHAYIYDFDTNTITGDMMPTMPAGHNLVYTSVANASNGTYYLISWSGTSNNLSFWTWTSATDTLQEIAQSYTMPLAYFQGASRVGNVWYIMNSAGSGTPRIILLQVATRRYIGSIILRGFGETEGCHVVTDADGMVYAYFADNSADKLYKVRLTGGSIPADNTCTVSGTAPVITAIPGCSYTCGTLDSLDFTPCASGLCSVRFTSGTTPTQLVLPSTVKMPAWWTGCAANTTYEISIADGVYGVVGSWAT